MCEGVRIESSRVRACSSSLRGAQLEPLNELAEAARPPSALAVLDPPNLERPTLLGNLRAVALRVSCAVPQAAIRV